MKLTPLFLALAALTTTGTCLAHPGNHDQQSPEHTQTPVKDPNAQAAENDPITPIIGRWTSNVTRFSSSTADTNLLNYNSVWTGRFYGTIKPTGVLIFKGDNGCILSGLASPFSTNNQWIINGKLEGCQTAHFNQRIFGNLRRADNNLLIEVTEIPFSVGKPAITYRIIATMRPY